MLLDGKPCAQFNAYGDELLGSMHIVAMDDGSSALEAQTPDMLHVKTQRRSSIHRSRAREADREVLASLAA